MQFRPCIDLHQGKVKQIVGSTLKDQDNSATVNFESDQSAGDYANLYRKDNLRGGHIIKLGPDNDEAAREALSAWPGGLQIGGGITAENAAEFITMGASHIIVTSYVFKDGKINFENLHKLVAAVGKDRLILDLSCKAKDDDYFIVTDRWQNFTDTKVSKETLQELAEYCDEFLVHAASVEGMMQGPDLKLVSLLAEHSPIPVTYAGGITTLPDIENVNKTGQGKVHITIGSALDLFGGKLSYQDVVEYCQQ
ncbi:phosphoribosylformimino-5-aminoimidazole carboxamide ribotide isomerase [Endozoicomonas sp. OPT23]|uniref:phosphoribosylformimino-5-aminoimidazole carboxamide ribotide isomerase n=1 Tax=Endozoicomonas sp. OPT23 TaxID=2072845 RepID=UPI00129AE495|nr:phosphoribosylformimino-5-aminoimidazole carboxamide ribotide isomerase [Endozoicomonas sp. OPT23]MRI31860.1 phosphoribosylformimino-5-aminoimidazole carboxamide ribotide isomerase [Endozoicomonas sp. OPT23]